MNKQQAEDFFRQGTVYVHTPQGHWERALCAFRTDNPKALRRELIVAAAELEAAYTENGLNGALFLRNDRGEYEISRDNTRGLITICLTHAGSEQLENIQSQPPTPDGCVLGAYKNVRNLLQRFLSV